GAPRGSGTHHPRSTQRRSCHEHVEYGHECSSPSYHVGARPDHAQNYARTADRRVIRAGPSGVAVDAGSVMHSAPVASSSPYDPVESPTPTLSAADDPPDRPRRHHDRTEVMHRGRGDRYVRLHHPDDDPARSPGRPRLRPPIAAQAGVGAPVLPANRRAQQDWGNWGGRNLVGGHGAYHPG